MTEPQDHSADESLPLPLSQPTGANSPLRENHIVQPTGDEEAYEIEPPPPKPEPPAAPVPEPEPANPAAAPASDGLEPDRPFSPGWYRNLQQTLGETACRQLGFFAVPPDLKLSIVIPVFNEERTLEAIVDRVCEVPLRKEILLVNDCSRDNSAMIIEKILKARANDPMNELRAHSHRQNRGKGAALRTGFEHVTGDIVLIQDADLEYDPSEYPRLIQPIIEGKADVVFGSRFLGDQPHRVLYYWHYLANKFLTTLSNCFTNLNLTDMETCFKVFRRQALQDVLPTLKQDRFGFEPEITAKIARRRYRVYELSVSYSGRTYDQGKHIGWKDGFQALWCIIRYGIAD